MQKQSAGLPVNMQDEIGLVVSLPNNRKRWIPISMGMTYWFILTFHLITILLFLLFFPKWHH